MIRDLLQEPARGYDEEDRAAEPRRDGRGRTVTGSQSWEVRQGDARAVLATLPEDSVQCVVTSIPYWGLRAYGTPPQVWGGDPQHGHEFSTVRVWSRDGAPSQASTLAGNGHVGGGPKLNREAGAADTGYCECGAWRGELGLEPTPWLYVEHVVEVFREVHRVLAKDGVLWLNLGDTYATGAGMVRDHPGGGEQGMRWAGEVTRHRDARRRPHGQPAKNGRGEDQVERTRALRDGTHAGKHTAMAAIGPMTQPNRMPIAGLKPKDRIGIPHRVVFALQADGWWWRDEIVWHKPNPMPSSVRDRTTSCHEFLFLLTKSKTYRYDAAAIMEPVTGNSHPRGNGVNPKADMPTGWDQGPGDHHGLQGRYAPHDQDGRSARMGRAAGWRAKKVSKSSYVRVDHIPRPRSKQNRSFSAAVTGLVQERNRRSVWTIATAPFSGAHFATFPQALVEPCILAGSRPGDLVCDPFAGAGTVAVVALRHGRRFLGIELNTDYCAMARRRIAGPLFAETPA